MPDPVQVVAEARGIHRLSGFECDCGERFEEPYHTTAMYEKHVNAAIAAALQAAGALMPEEAEQERRAVSRYAYERTQTDALLQEARAVLESSGPHAEHETIVGSCVCGRPWPCPEASLLHKIETAWSSAGGGRDWSPSCLPAPTAHGEAGSQAVPNSGGA